MDDLLADFLTETNESLAELDVALVRLERTPDDEQTLSQIFRLMHTIKGTCGFLGLPRLEQVAHAAENVLVRLRERAIAATPDVISTVLFALDRIKEIVGGLAAAGTEPAGDDSALVAVLTEVAEGRQPAATPAAQVSAAPAAMPPAPPGAAPDGPDAASLSTAAPAANEAPPEPAEAVREAEATIAGQTIRVGVDVLENLMTLVSELVLTRNQLLQLARGQEDSGLQVPLQRLSHITSDLQEGVMKTRMQPIGNAWNKLPRLVRDLARDLDKRIELVMHGADTELDRQVLELIKDPLTHMVRNSGDHGLESPAERRAAGKPETGRITLNAFHEGGHILIEIGDDGRGLATEKIRAKVLARGLATETELATMTEAQIQRFIFRPGFSTAEAVTAVSGRGVGMDVVKTNIEKIGGTIELKSQPGHGTTFVVKIPLTLAIVSALIVQAGRERFAIPQLSVVELVRAGTEAERDGTATGKDGSGEQRTESRIERIDGTPVLRLRDRLLPLVGLAELMRLEPDPTQEAGNRSIVVTQVGATLLGIIVDRVFDTEEIVVKPVAPILRHITMFSGNTILGDGSVIMILDPNGIARAQGIAGSELRPEAMTGTVLAQSGQRIAVLLFRAGGPEPKAVPLSLVSRLEDIASERIEISAGQPVVQYRGRLMPLVPLAGALDRTKPRHAVLVFNDVDRGLGRDRCMGLVVDEILDVVEDRMSIELSGDRPGLLGTAVLAGRATDVIDTAYWLTRAAGDWFRNDGSGVARAGRLLVVEDSDFFRNLLIPALSAEGYEVVGCDGPSRALQLREAGAMFDAIISDIEMPDMHGLDFVRRLRAEGPWASLPVIALSGRVCDAEVTAGRAAGFTDYVGKFDRPALMASLRQCLGETVTSA
ncbi:Signal transduction histidine kinase CheA [Rhodovastum atsumiense]|uniref:Chemotaxis protein CheA n=1 Tax=Rhodovastum atsumiense TaxID=504468 RepID=A0A5M6IV08_9PROT|nr:chemotaxis protein CheW [Rhodovastum atsumiense]KAA5612102.1 hybrid sensor histidine kinase/response regulator [Rhodovastum atsumiense]CAH2604014.1 Signal transduction histidine kinase CheA [Rhodovastum atsumiense]